MAVKIFFVGLAIAFVGWSIAWFLENGVVGASIFALGFLIAIVGLAGSFVKTDVTWASNTKSLLRLPKSRTANAIGFSGVAIAILGEIISEHSTEANAGTLLFYLGFGLIGLAVCIYLYRFYKGKKWRKSEAK